MRRTFQNENPSQYICIPIRVVDSRSESRLSSRTRTLHARTVDGTRHHVTVTPVTTRASGRRPRLSVWVALVSQSLTGRDTGSYSVLVAAAPDSESALKSSAFLSCTQLVLCTVCYPAAACQYLDSLALSVVFVKLSSIFKNVLLISIKYDLHNLLKVKG